MISQISFFPKTFSRLFLIFLLVAGVIALLMTVELLPKPDNTYFWRALFDGGHAPLFGTMALIFLWLIRLLPLLNKRPVTTQFLIAAGVAMIFGIGVEISQIGTGRDADPMDVARNMAGIISFLLVAATLDSRLRPNATKTDDQPERSHTPWFRYRWWIRIVALVIFAIPFARAAKWAVTTIDRNLRFPVIANFESFFDMMPIAVNFGDARRTSMPASFTLAEGQMVGEILLRPVTVNPDPMRYPTVQLEEPYPDWSAYDSLVFAVFLEDSLPRELWIRIHDRKHNSHPTDRFNRSLTLQPGEQRIAISVADIISAPRKRTMDRTRMRSIRFFLSPDQPEIYFLLDNLHLK